MYLTAALSIGAYYDAVYGAGPVERHAVLLRCGVAGAFLFGCASLLSFWKPHWAVLVGTPACCLCWADFSWIVPYIPFLHVFSVIGYANWNETLVAFLVLVLATAYSLWQVGRPLVVPILE